MDLSNLRKLTYYAVLKHQVGCSFLRAFGREQKCEDLVIFITAVEKYRSTLHSLEKDAKYRQAKTLFETYLDPSKATFSVPLPPNLEQPLSELFATSSPPDQNIDFLFDEAEAEIYNVFSSRVPLSSFLNTHHYKALESLGEKITLELEPNITCKPLSGSIFPALQIGELVLVVTPSRDDSVLVVVPGTDAMGVYPTNSMRPVPAQMVLLHKQAEEEKEREQQASNKSGKASKKASTKMKIETKKLEKKKEKEDKKARKDSLSVHKSKDVAVSPRPDHRDHKEHSGGGLGKLFGKKKHHHKEETVISGPTEVSHDGHLGVSNKGFEARNLPPALQEIFMSLNSMLKEMGMKGISTTEAKFLLKYVSANMGPDGKFVAPNQAAVTTPAAAPALTTPRAVSPREERSSTTPGNSQPATWKPSGSTSNVVRSSTSDTGLLRTGVSKESIPTGKQLNKQSGQRFASQCPPPTTPPAPPSTAPPPPSTVSPRVALSPRRKLPEGPPPAPLTQGPSEADLAARAELDRRDREFQEERQRFEKEKEKFKMQQAERDRKEEEKRKKQEKRKQLMSMNSDAEELRRLRSQVNEMKEREVGLETTMEGLQKELAALKEEHELLKSTTCASEEQLMDLRDKKQQLETENSTLKIQVSELEGRLAASSSKESHFDVELKKIQAKMNERLQDCGKQIENEKKQRAELQDKIKNLTNTVESQKSTITYLEGDQRLLQGQLKQAKLERNDLQINRDALKEEIEAMKEELEDKERTITNLERLRGLDEVQMDKLRVELENALSRSSSSAAPAAAAAPREVQSETPAAGISGAPPPPPAPAPPSAPPPPSAPVKGEETAKPAALLEAIRNPGVNLKRVVHEDKKDNDGGMLNILAKAILDRRAGLNEEGEGDEDDELLWD